MMSSGITFSDLRDAKEYMDSKNAEGYSTYYRKVGGSYKVYIVGEGLALQEDKEPWQMTQDEFSYEPVYFHLLPLF